jgi:hypothetical protein
MKLEEIKNKTNEAVGYLVAALQSGESEVLTAYLNAMARFHQYSFGNVMMIARQKRTQPTWQAFAPGTRLAAS